MLERNVHSMTNTMIGWPSIAVQSLNSLFILFRTHELLHKQQPSEKADSLLGKRNTALILWVVL